MTDIKTLKALAESVQCEEWGCSTADVCRVHKVDGTTYVQCWSRVAECTDVDIAKFIAAANPAAVLELIAEIERLQRGRTDWQVACLKRGFTYCREPDDHYVLADVPEMAALLGEVIGVEVRDRENDSYGETVSDLKDQVDAGIDAFHRAYQAETERDQLKTEKESLEAENEDTLQRFEKAVEEVERLRAQLAVQSDVLADCDELRKDLESHKRMLLRAACDLGAVGEALGAEMDDDASEMEGIASELRKDAERYRWLTSNWFTMTSSYAGGVKFHTEGERWSNLAEGSIDEAIDAAMNKESTK